MIKYFSIGITKCQDKIYGSSSLLTERDRLPHIASDQRNPRWKEEIWRDEAPKREATFL